MHTAVNTSGNFETRNISSPISKTSTADKKRMYKKANCVPLPTEKICTCENPVHLHKKPNKTH